MHTNEGRLYNRAYQIQERFPILMGTRVDSEYNHATKSRLVSWLKTFLGERDGKILEIGAGDGDLGNFLPGKHLWYATDISIVGLNTAKKRFSTQIIPAIASGINLPFVDGSFEATVAADCMEHMPSPEKAISEVHRVLKPGGLFVLTVPTPDSLRNWFKNQLSDGISFKLIQLLIKTALSVAVRTAFFGTPTFQPIDYDFDTDQWLDLLQKNGFIINQVEKWPLDPKKPMVSLISAIKSL